MRLNLPICPRSNAPRLHWHGAAGHLLPSRQPAKETPSSPASPAQARHVAGAARATGPNAAAVTAAAAAAAAASFTVGQSLAIGGLALPAAQPVDSSTAVDGEGGLPATKRRGVAAGRGSPVYQLLCGQGGPVRPDEKTIKPTSERAFISLTSSKQQQPKWPLRRRLARRAHQTAMDILVPLSVSKLF